MAPNHDAASGGVMRRAKESGPKRVIGIPEHAANVARGVMRDHQETFVVLCLDVRNQLIGKPTIVAIGTLTGVEVHPREVFTHAIRAHAAGIVVLHNHPSGDPTPSVDDLALTRRLKECGDLLGIPVVDHVVVTRASFASIAEYQGF